MKFRPIIALALCAALTTPGAAQVRVAAGAYQGPAGVSVVPMIGGLGLGSAPSLNSGLSAASLSLGLAPVPAPAPAVSAEAAPALALAIPLLPAAAIATPVSVKAAVPAALALVKISAPSRATPSGSVPVAALRADGEKFWSGAAAKGETDDAVPVDAAPAKAPSRLLRGAAALSPAAAVLPHLPHWAAAAAPYAEAGAILAFAYGLTRVSRWAVDKLAPRFGWDKNAVVMARFVSNLVLWTAGAGAGLVALGVTGTALMATFGAGGTAMALAITLAVRDVAGNLFHGVHFLLARPFTVGDKVTIGKTTGVVHDLTLRYLVLKDETGGYILYTYNNIAAAAVTLYGRYTASELRLSLKKPAFPRGLLRALRDAATPALWKPILFSALAIAALSFFPLLTPALKGTSVSWLTTILPYVKAGVVALLTGSLARSFKAGAERLGARYGWTRPATTVAKLGIGALTWIIGGSFLLNAAGVSWAWVAGTLSLSTVFVSIAVNDYISAVFQGALVLTLKPFQIGDRVTIGELAGTVVDITLQYVVIKNDEQSYMLIPHSVVKDSAIITPREYGQRRK